MHSSPSRSGVSRRLLRAAVVLAVALSLLPGVGAPVAHATEGLEQDGSTTYRLEPRKGNVHVTVKVDLVNTMPARTEGAYISTPYFDSFAVPAMGPVRNARARSSAGGNLDVEIEKGRMGISGVIVDLEPNLVNGSPQTVTIEYDLPNQPPRSDSVTRVNKGFASWFVFGAGDPGAIDIRIEAPADFDVTLSRPVKVVDSRQGDLNIVEMNNVAKFENAALFASATNEAGIAGKQLKVGDTDVTVKAWPGDLRWQRFASGWTRKGLPVLGELIGVDAVQDDLTVAESSRSYQLGYAGFYVPSEGRVEVGDMLDKTTLLHELAHVWFNRHMFTERWLGEGLAESYANRALKELGAKPKPPRRIDIDDPARVPLNAWPPIAVLDPKREKVERYAYNASYSVVEELIDEIGIDGMRKVLVAASQRQLPYPGLPDAEEETLIERDWRYFFDLVEMVGGSKEVDSIFRDQVLTPAEAALLPQRDDVHRKLEVLEKNGPGWIAPLAVRESLAAWEFGTTKGLIQYATDLRDRSQATMDQLRSVDVDVAASLEEQYAGAKELEDYDEALQGLEETTEEIVALRRRVDAAGPVASLGLMGADLGFDRINQAVTDGELDRVPDIVATASDQLDQAPTRGARILGGAALLVLILMVLWLLRRRRRRAPEIAATVDGTPDDLRVEDAQFDPPADHDEAERVQ